jgi:hypothetical protein
MREYFHHLGWEPYFISKKEDLLSYSDKKGFKKIFIELKSLSDILLLDTLHKLNPNKDIVLIVQPELSRIISILSEHKYKTIEGFLQLEKEVKKRNK